ncbi:MarR family transcriptional regulator (plasmid) [Aggregatilineales bacterium SYSU G02658]
MSDKLRHAAAELKMLGALIMKVGRESFEQRMQREGYEISALQFGLIRMLAMDGEHSLKELSQKFMVDPSTLVPAIDALERKAVVFRHRDAQDRRRVVIGLTEHGHSLAQRFHAVGDDDAIYQAILQMGEADVERLLGLMRALIQALPDGDQMMDSLCARLRSAQSPPPANQEDT